MQESKKSAERQRNPRRIGDSAAPSIASAVIPT